VADHQPVLVQEVLRGLALMDDGWYVDGTYGRGGHSAEILARLGQRGRLLALDKDPDAVCHGRRRFSSDARFSIQQCGFEALRACVEPWLGERRLDGMLLDLGVSSPQLEDASRGFSITRDGPLDMRMNPREGQSAAEWLAGVSETELARVLRRYGEVPGARQMAAAITKARAQAPIRTTGRLARIVVEAAVARRRRLHPATRVFQALRIHVNRELAALAAALPQCVELLGPAGRLCVISFHSLEDRIVKRFMADEALGDPAYAGLPDVPPEARPRLRLVGRLIRPRAEEVARNPRARSARLRVAERVGERVR
jgi:16S rRNA (cytosine1402-N4)-methyltransferase